MRIAGFFTVRIVAAALSFLCIGSVFAQAAWAQTSQLLEYPTIHKPVVGARAMVVSQSELASDVGRRILEEGGNAIDAAVATAFALAVTLPRAGNIGGDGFMIIHLAEQDRSVVIDYRSVAPAAASLQAYLDDAGSVSGDARAGVRSAGVPGTVAGLEMAHRKYGKLAWKRLLEPAIEMAAMGVVLTRDEAWTLEWGKERLSRSDAGKRIFLRGGDAPYAAGDVLRQPDLAWSLRQIAEGGAEAFYRGPIAKRIAAGMREAGGFLTERDLAAYRAIERPALLGSYRGHRIATVPPASGGGASLLELLNILERFDLRAGGAGSARTIHLLAEAMKLSFVDRWRHAGDADHVAVPTAGLVDKDYAKSRAAAISERRAAPVQDVSPGNPWAFESEETTHFSVVDEAGNVVSNTFTLGSDFGSGVVMEGTGFLLGNLIGNFSLSRQAEMLAGGPARTANLLAPGRRPVSSMAPTIVFRNGKPWIVTGSPGGSTIIGTIAQIVVNSIDFDMNIAEATNFPRIFQDIESGKLRLEPGISPDTEALLRDWGHDPATGRTMGSAQSIRIEGRELHGSADPRRPGAAAAPLE